MPTRSFF